MADAGGFDGFAAPSNITPELEHWFAQISAEMQKAAVGIGGIAANTDDLLQYNGTDWVAVADINADSIAAGTFGAGAYAFTGGNVSFSNALLMVGSDSTKIRFTDTSITDLSWDIRISDPAGVFELRSITDAGTTVLNTLQIAHATGYATFVDGAEFNDEVLINSGLTIARAAGALVRIRDTGSVSDTDVVSYISLQDSASAEKGWMGFGSGANTNLTIRNSITNADIVLSTSGTGTVQAAYLGAVATPTYSWTGDPDTGVYRYFTDNVGIVGGGTHIAHFDSALGMVAYPGMYAVNGTAGTFRHVAWSASSLVTSNLKYISGSVAAASSYQYIDAAGASDAGGVVFNAFANGTGRGFYAMVAPTSLGAATTVTTLDYILAVDSNGVRAASGAVGTPSFSFINDSNTGMYQYASNDIGFSCTGAVKFRITASYIYPYVQIRHVQSGTGADPSYSFNTDPDTGMYLAGVGSLGFTVAGAQRYTVSNTALVLAGGMRLSHNNDNTRDKIRVWDSNLYTIGMGTAYTFGGLTNYAMTFQMNTTTSRGWWWGTDLDTNAQGSMALTQEGRLTVALYSRFGYGKSDTTAPNSAYAIDANGSIQAVANASNIIMKTVSATSSPYIAWYQTTTRQMYMQYLNGGTGRINVEGSSTYVFEIMTGGVKRFRIDGLDADEGRVYAENAQMYGGYINSGTGTGATTVDFDRGNTHHLNNTGSRTMTISGAVNGTTGIITVESNTGATASWTWSTNIEWVGGSAPTLSTTVGHRDVIMLIYSDNAWLGSYTIGHV